MACLCLVLVIALVLALQLVLGPNSALVLALVSGFVLGRVIGLILGLDLVRALGVVLCLVSGVDLGLGRILCFVLGLAFYVDATLTFGRHARRPAQACEVGTLGMPTVVDDGGSINAFRALPPGRYEDTYICVYMYVSRVR